MDTIAICFNILFQVAQGHNQLVLSQCKTMQTYTPTHPPNISSSKRTWGDREGHWGRWLWYVIVTKVIFSFRKSVFRDAHTDYNLDQGFLVKLKKQISMIMADLS